MKNGLSSFIFGGLIGAILALLFAPRSGEETRQMLTERGNAMKENALQSIREAQDAALASMNEAQARLQVINEETRKLWVDLQEIGETVVAQQVKTIENSEVLKGEEDE